MAKTGNDRQDTFRGKRIAAGFQRKDFWVHPDDYQKLRDLEKDLFRARLKELEKEGVVTRTGRGGFDLVRG